MKVIISDVISNPIKKKYPYIGYSDKFELHVLFTEPKMGVVLKAGSSKLSSFYRKCRN